MKLEDKFNAAVEIVQKLPKEGPLSTSNDGKLKFYSLYKQATVGNVTGQRPSIFSLIERYKWDAWKAIENMDKDAAMQKYIDAVNESFDKAAESMDIDVWLGGDELDPVIKTNLALISTK